MSRRLLLAFLVAGFAAWACAPAFPQVQPDPLTPQEADQVRSTADHLDKRVPLLLRFAADRLARFDQVRTASPRPPGRDPELYSLLTQYKAILPEADDAVDDLAQYPKQYKVAKVLDAAIASLQAMATTLRHLQTASTPADLANYHFMLQDCLDVTGDSLQNAQQTRAQAGKPARR
ncbi:MAG TPA: hypothetical protein VMV31_00080 [Terriglobales bacterium]|nr:hypothetical protein [Terriglobales bacterium]